MFKRIHLLFFFTCFSGGIFTSAAQSNQPEQLAVADISEKAILANDGKAALGTYQFIVDPKGLDEAFTNDILVIAELLRQENETTYHQLSPNVTLKIISRREISERKFVDEFLILKNEK